MTNPVNATLCERNQTHMFDWDSDQVLSTIIAPLKEPDVAMEEAAKLINKAVAHYLSGESDADNVHYYGILINIHVTYLHLFVLLYSNAEAERYNEWEPDDIWFTLNGEQHCIPREWEINECDVTKEIKTGYSIEDSDWYTKAFYQGRKREYSYGMKVIETACDLKDFEWLADDGEHYFAHVKSVAKGLTHILEPSIESGGVVVDMDISFLHAFAFELSKIGVVLHYMPEGCEEPIRILQPKLI